MSPSSCLFRLANGALNFRSLTNTVTKIIEFRSTYSTGTDNFDVLDVRAVNRENSLYAYAISNTANGESLGNSRASLGNYSTLEGLSSLSVALFDSYVNTYGITDVEFREVFLLLAFSDDLKCVHGNILLKINRTFIRRYLPEDRPG